MPLNNGRNLGLFIRMSMSIIRYKLRKTHISKIDHHTKRKIKEKVKVKMDLDNVNIDKGMKLNKTWNPLLQELANQQHNIMVSWNQELDHPEGHR